MPTVGTAPFLSYLDTNLPSYVEYNPTGYNPTAYTNALEFYYDTPARIGTTRLSGILISRNQASIPSA
jgi:hypothetical protein